MAFFVYFDSQTKICLTDKRLTANFVALGLGLWSDEEVLLPIQAKTNKDIFK